MIEQERILEFLARLNPEYDPIRIQGLGIRFFLVFGRSLLKFKGKKVAVCPTLGLTSNLHSSLPLLWILKGFMVLFLL